MTTRVFITPAEHLEAANAMAEAAGWGGPVFVQPLSASGVAPFTHWGFPAVMDEIFTEAWGRLPEDAAALLAASYVGDESGDDAVAHWRSALAAQELAPWDGIQENLPMTGDMRTFGGKVWESLVDYNVWLPGVYGWREVVEGGPDVPEWSPSGVYTQGQIVTDAEGVRRWALQTASETAAVGREPWQAYMWAVWQEVT